MARKRKAGRKTTSRRKSTTRRKKSASVRARSSSAYKRRPNPKRRKRSRRTVARSSRRRSVKRRSNPLISGNVAEAGKLVGATIAINFVNANFVAPVAGRFIPGQFAQPVSLWATGQGLGWLAGMTSFTRPFAPALKLMSWVLSIGALVTPIVSGFLNRSTGRGNGVNGMRGIGAWPPVPGMGLNAAALGPAKTGTGGMKGVGSWRPVGA